MNTRIERDTFGDIEVPADHLWGAQTQRSLEHFRISGERMPPALIRALALVKRACATVNRELGQVDGAKADAIIAFTYGMSLALVQLDESAWGATNIALPPERGSMP